MRCFGSQSEPTETVGLRKFRGAVAIITGGASGIGRALAEALVGKDAQAVVLVDRQVELAEEVAAGIRARADCDTEVKVYEADVTDYAAVERVVAETQTTYGRLDYIFNNAGIAVIGPTDTCPVEDFDRVIGVNVWGVSHGVQAAYPVMKEQKFGHIVNTGSVAGLVPGPGTSSYSASKYAVVGLSTSLRAEAAEHGVRVSVLCPGFINTPMFESGGKYGKDLVGMDRMSPEVKENFHKKLHPMDPDLFAEKALRAVAANKAIIVIPGFWKLFCWIHRMSPSLGMYLSKKQYQKVKKELKKAIPVPVGTGEEAAESPEESPGESPKPLAR
jgi:NAD(P)-dependent dehydrogenase (short-subunit alcohol dehydrogenase family)